MYASDNGGSYPARLEALKANYLIAIPTCPIAGAGADLYTRTYERRFNPASFSLSCAGGHSLPRGVDDGYDAEQGLLDHP